ncbi:MAG: DUF488 domain-containing protein [Actinomycetales bacterium]|jgi:uncharacterized protein (DUF488 family)|nr:DUF488 domain-containing protein [Actinomycetales bacterium]
MSPLRQLEPTIERNIEAVTAEPERPRVIWTIGHWTCPREVFLRNLADADIDHLVDIRAHPGSRRSPQFGADELPRWLREAGIGYERLPDLGGRRPPQDVDPDVNGGWLNASFHHYADYTLTPGYERGLTRLGDLADTHRVVLMCGEPMPWRCHRLLVANTLAARGWQVWHLLTTAAPRRHTLGIWGATPVTGPDAVVTYPTGDIGRKPLR